LENLIGDINGNSHESASPHHCSIIEIKNDSYRFKQSQQKALKQQPEGGSIFDAYVGQNWMLIDTWPISSTSLT